jgi:hypothetical protein
VNFSLPVDCFNGPRNLAHYADPKEFSHSISPFNSVLDSGCSGRPGSTRATACLTQSLRAGSFAWGMTRGRLTRKRFCSQRSTVVTLLFYTVVTQLLHCCYNIVTILLHCCYTVITLLHGGWREAGWRADGGIYSQFKRCLHPNDIRMFWRFFNRFLPFVHLSCPQSLPDLNFTHDFSVLFSLLQSADITYTLGW